MCSKCSQFYKSTEEWLGLQAIVGNDTCAGVLNNSGGQLFSTQVSSSVFVNSFNNCHPNRCTQYLKLLNQTEASVILKYLYNTYTICTYTICTLIN